MSSSSSIPTSSSSIQSDNQQAKRPRFDRGRLPTNSEEVDVKLRESAEYLQEWTILMDRTGNLIITAMPHCIYVALIWTENMPASEISKIDLLKHVSLVS